MKGPNDTSDLFYLVLYEKTDMDRVSFVSYTLLMIVIRSLETKEGKVVQEGN